ncbi:MAG: hypothetical protein V4671_15610, partial [Armatimonadota bacterium]
MYANCFAQAPQDPRDLTYRQIKHEWDVFTRNPATVTFVVEDRSRVELERVCGCGQMVFVQQDFADWVHETRKPGINGEAARQDKQHLLDFRQMRSANSSKGVIGLVTRWHSGTEGSFPESFRAGVRAVLYRGMMDFFLGFKFREIIGETNGHQAFQYAQDAGFRVLNRFSDYYSVPNTPEPRYGLVHITREQALQNDATRISQLFVDYRAPRLHLNETSRELLQLAMLGYGDSEIARLTGCSLKGIQKRWYVLSALERSNP